MCQLLFNWHLNLIKVWTQRYPSLLWLIKAKTQRYPSLLWLLKTYSFYATSNEHNAI